MKYLPLMILAVLMMGLIVGCANTGVPATTQTATDTATVASEAGNAVDSAMIDDTEEVQIGEMI